MSSDQIADGFVISLAYTLKADGEIIEVAPQEEPLDYLHGAENIVPGLEAALTGKKVGDKMSVTLEPKDAYGEYDEEDTEWIERGDLPEEIEEGMELLLEDEDGNFFEATVKEVSDQGVLLDFNPMLAGKTVTYDVEIVGIRKADEEEMMHGHPHSYEDDEEFYDAYEDEDYSAN